MNKKHDHTALLGEVKSEMPKDELLSDLADLFKIFGDTTRIKILYALFESEMCVCAIAELLNMTQSAISHQRAEEKLSRVIAQGGENRDIRFGGRSRPFDNRSGLRAHHGGRLICTGAPPRFP